MEMVKLKQKKGLALSKSKGFSLIEFVVAVGIFTALIITMTALTMALLKGQRKVFALQDIQESGRFILESISKEIRMSTINSSAGTWDSLDINNMRGDPVVYTFFDDGISKRLLRNGDPVSPESLDVTGSFIVTYEIFPGERYLVTFVMQLSTSGGRPEENAEAYVQTTLAPRAYR